MSSIDEQKSVHKSLYEALKYSSDVLDDAACEALTDMPPRGLDELDAVTLHNQALMNMEAKPTEGFPKMQFLLQQNPFPPETFGNLLLLYIKYEVRTTLEAVSDRCNDTQIQRVELNCHDWLVL